MFRFFSALLLTMMTGCAVYSPAESLAMARNSPDWELCYVAVSGRGQQNIRQAVYQVMQERRTDCNQHAALVQAKMAQDSARSSANAAAGLMLMQAGRAQPAPPQPAVQANCRTFNRGGYLQTVCD